MQHILVAEDEEGIARVIERGLRAEGYRTTVVGDGLAALEAATGGDVDLLVLNEMECQTLTGYDASSPSDLKLALASLLELGVDGIVTDRADLLRDVLRARGLWA